MIRAISWLECPSASRHSVFISCSVSDGVRLHRRFRPSITRFILLIKLLKSLFTSTTAQENPERSLQKLAIGSMFLSAIRMIFRPLSRNFLVQHSFRKYNIFPNEKSTTTIPSGTKQVSSRKTRSFTARLKNSSCLATQKISSLHRECALFYFSLQSGSLIHRRYI